MKKNILMLALLLGAAAAAFAQEPVAVVVSPNNSTTNITIDRLREIFQCDRTTWPSGEHVAVFTRPASTTEHNVMLRSIFRMGESDYKQFWVVKQMRGEISCKVTELPSKGMTIEAVRSFNGALALVRRSDLTKDMKVLSVNGKRPDDADYPLQ